MYLTHLLRFQPIYCAFQSGFRFFFLNTFVMCMAISLVLVRKNNYISLVCYRQQATLLDDSDTKLHVH